MPKHPLRRDRRRDRWPRAANRAPRPSWPRAALPRCAAGFTQGFARRCRGRVRARLRARLPARGFRPHGGEEFFDRVLAAVQWPATASLRAIRWRARRRPASMRATQVPQPDHHLRLVGASLAPPTARAIIRPMQTVASILWRRLDVPGHDACRLERNAARAAARRRLGLPRRGWPGGAAALPRALRPALACAVGRGARLARRQRGRPLDHARRAGPLEAQRRTGARSRTASTSTWASRPRPTCCSCVASISRRARAPTRPAAWVDLDGGGVLGELMQALRAQRQRVPSYVS